MLLVPDSGGDCAWWCSTVGTASTGCWIRGSCSPLNSCNLYIHKIECIKNETVAYTGCANFFKLATLSLSLSHSLCFCFSDMHTCTHKLKLCAALGWLCGVVIWLIITYNVWFVWLPPAGWTPTSPYYVHVCVLLNEMLVLFWHCVCNYCIIM